MPLLYQQDINENTRLGLWLINESEQFFLEKGIQPPNIRHPGKRRQTLAGRHLLQVLHPGFPLKQIQLAATRKPFLPGDPLHFSISHCGNLAAAIVSTHNRVGVDVEAPVERLFSIRKKFLTPQEEAVLEISQSDGLKMLTMSWCIKEALFKWYGAGGVDFRQHMQIRNISCVRNRYHAQVAFLKGMERHLSVNGIYTENHCMAWLVTSEV